MTALSAKRLTQSKSPLGCKYDFPVAASTTIYAGSMVVVNSAGYAVPAASLANNKGVFGVALETVDNSSGLAAAKDVTVQAGIYEFTCSTATQANTGSIAYAEDDQTVDTVKVGDEPVAGIIVDYASATSVWVAIGPEYLYPAAADSGQRTNKVVYEDFSGYAATDLVANCIPTAGTPSGTAGTINHMYTPGGNVYGFFPVGTLTAMPLMAAGYLDLSGDGSNDEGYEVFSHWLGATGRPFTVYTDAAFYFLCKFQLDDADGTDDLQIGFRQAEPEQQAFDDYTDCAAFSICTAADPTAIKIETILNNGSTSTTDTTQTVDLAARTLSVKIKVSAAGVVTFQHDATTEGTLAAPTATASYTFATGMPVIPFFRYINASGVTAVKLLKWDVGYQG